MTQVIRTARWRKRNPDVARAQARRHYATHREHYLAKMRRLYHRRMARAAWREVVLLILGSREVGVMP